MRAREQQPTQRPRALRAARAVRAAQPAGPGLALGLAWLFVRRAWLAGRWPGFVLGLVRQASSDAYSYDTLPIKFPIPEFISDTNNI